jgi:hypothetical protein
MTMRGVHFAVSDATLMYLVSIPSVDERVALISNVVEDGWDAEKRCDTDKAWGLIHATLQNTSPCADSLERSSDRPPSWVILGREYINSPDNYIVGLTHAADVGEVFAHLSGLSRPEFEIRLEHLAEQHGCDNIGRSDIEYAAHWYERLVAFFERAAAAELNVIFTVDF